VVSEAAATQAAPVPEAVAEADDEAAPPPVGEAATAAADPVEPEPAEVPAIAPDDPDDPVAPDAPDDPVAPGAPDDPGAPDEPADDPPVTPADEESGTSAEADSAPPPDVGLVALIRGVPRYHQPECVLIRFMPDEDIQKLSVPEAKEAGCTPCSACQPAEA
jgi:hypothetical protein